MYIIICEEKTLESLLDCKEIQPVHSEGDQPWDFFERNDAKAETPVLWPPHAKSWLIGKVADAGRDWGQEEKGTTEDEMAGWYHRLNGCESEWTPGVGDGQGGLACCDSWGCKESDTTERLIWSDLIICEIDHQSRFYAWGRVLRDGVLGLPWRMGWGGIWEGGSGWGTHVHPWLIHVNVWQKPLQYCTAISLQLK